MTRTDPYQGLDSGTDSEAQADTDDAAPDEADGSLAPDASEPQPGDVIVNPAVTYQTMAGFGASDVWGSGLSSGQAQLFFDPVNGIGLSLLRLGIDVNGEALGAGAISDVKLATAYGARVWATPWSPPPAYKDNQSEDNGGYLCASAGQGECTENDYDNWATTLASFPGWLTAQTGASLYALSPQNEPEFPATYSSCLYTASQMVSFIDVLGPKLAALNPPVKLIAPEPDNWSDLWAGAADCSQTNDYGPCIEADPVAASSVAILATHDYGYNPVAPPSGIAQPIWETEVSGVKGSSQVGPSVDITNGLAVANWIYQAIVTGGVSAWHYWWLVSLNYDNEGLLFQTGQGPGALGDLNSPPKRLFALGNFSKFVRPGDQRIDVSGPVPAGVQVAAFSEPGGGAPVIVAINANASATPISLFLSGETSPAQVTPWVTSASTNLASQPAVELSGGRLVVALDAQSVTTFVGTM